jgi:hypothetical protein
MFKLSQNFPLTEYKLYELQFHTFVYVIFNISKELINFYVDISDKSWLSHEKFISKSKNEFSLHLVY